MLPLGRETQICQSELQHQGMVRMSRLQVGLPKQGQDKAQRDGGPIHLELVKLPCSMRHECMRKPAAMQLL